MSVKRRGAGENQPRHARRHRRFRHHAGSLDIDALEFRVRDNADMRGVERCRMDHRIRPFESGAQVHFVREIADDILGDVFDGSGGVAESDLQRASDIATIMLASLGLESLQYCDVSSSRELEELRRDDPVLRRRIERLLEAELLRATAIIQARRRKAEEIARAIVNRGVVRGCEVMDIVSRPKGDGAE